MGKPIVQHRRGSTAEWTEKGTITPLEGEIVIEIDDENKEHKLKIGDGVTPYKDLNYLQAGGDVVTQKLPKIIYVTLYKNKWTIDSNGRSYQQVMNNAKSNCRLDLQYDDIMFNELKSKNVVLTTENHSGDIYVYSSGDLPDKDYTIQASIIEVDIEDETIEKIIGIPAVLPLSNTVLDENEDGTINIMPFDPNEISEEESSKLVTQGALIERLGYNSEGRSVKYYITKSGWHRVLKMIRADSGIVHFGLSTLHTNTTKGKEKFITQTLGLEIAGGVKSSLFQNDEYKGKIIQLYNNIANSVGTNSADDYCKITAVRLAYPDQNNDNIDVNNDGKISVSDFDFNVKNPVNCYLDVYFAINNSTESNVAFTMSYAGKSNQHLCDTIYNETTEDNWTSIKNEKLGTLNQGMYGEQLKFYNFNCSESFTQYMPEDKILANNFNKSYINTLNPFDKLQIKNFDEFLFVKGKEKYNKPNWEDWGTLFYKVNKSFPNYIFRHTETSSSLSKNDDGTLTVTATNGIKSLITFQKMCYNSEYEQTDESKKDIGLPKNAPPVFLPVGKYYLQDAQIYIIKTQERADCYKNQYQEGSYNGYIFDKTGLYQSKPQIITIDEPTIVNRVAIVATSSKIIPYNTILCPLLIPIPSEVTTAEEISVKRFDDNNVIQIKYNEQILYTKYSNTPLFMDIPLCINNFYTTEIVYEDINSIKAYFNDTSDKFLYSNIGFEYGYAKEIEANNNQIVVSETQPILEEGQIWLKPTFSNAIFQQPSDYITSTFNTLDSSGNTLQYVQNWAINHKVDGFIRLTKNSDTEIQGVYNASPRFFGAPGFETKIAEGKLMIHNHNDFDTTAYFILIP